MTHDLKTRFGPTALVTGASDGIGRAFARALAAQGFDLVLVARRAPALEDLAEDLARRHAIRAEVIATDLAVPGAVADLMARTADTPIGLVIAAAGYGSAGRFLDLDPVAEAGMVDLNCRSVVELAQGMARRMAPERRGGIVLLGSLVGFCGVPFSATYAATKGFVQSLAEGLAVELGPLGITVLSVAPGPVGTGFAARARMRMGRTETPEAVARVALAALRRGGTVRPGALAKALGWGLATLPRGLRVRVLGGIMRSMAQP
jgi:uncharacterized protein